MARFCPAPWLAVNVRGNGVIAPCCAIEFEDVYTWDDYYNSPQLLRVQQDFQNGIEPPECKQCWELDDANSESLYSIFSGAVSRNSVNFDGPNLPKYLALATTQVCNLQCRICGPVSSTRHITEHNVLYDLGFKTEKWTKPAWKPLKDQIHLDWIRENEQDLEYIQFIGGEVFATLHDEQVELLTAFKNPENITLSYTTNGTIMPPLAMMNLWNRFKKITLTVSIDGTKDVFEYGRYPAKWDTVEQNLSIYQALAMRTPIYIKITNTVSALNVFNLVEFENWRNQLGIPATYSLLFDAPYYSVANLAPEIKDHIIEYLTGYPMFTHIIAHMKTHYDSDMTKDLVYNLEMLDGVRKQSYKDVLPEIYLNYFHKSL
jgi:MoaA/NifB/PqqE/SkfB family radical SAM enzyme